MLKMIILPRQARDKHRDSSKQTIVFFATLELGELLEPYATESLYMCCCPEPYLPCTLSERDSTYGKQPFGAILHCKRPIYQDRLGTNIVKVDTKGRLLQVRRVLPAPRHATERK